jgi:hypothetical protein
MSLDRRRINVKGGGSIQLREIDPTPAATFSNLGYTKEESLIDAFNVVESVDSIGNLVNASEGGRKPTWSVVLMQTSKAEIDFLLITTKYYEVYYVVTLANGYFQEIVCPVCRLKPGGTLKFAAGTERSITLDIYILAPAVALTRTPTNFNTVKFQPFAITENAAAVGAPSDAGTVPQGGI